MSKYFAFISYSHRDERWAKWLHKKLETYRPPKRLVGRRTPLGDVPAKIPPVFRDRDELASAVDLSEVIRGSLSESGRQIVICSPAAARSKWVNEEIKAFKRLGREDRVFCLIVDGEPNAAEAGLDPDLECFPEAVKYRMGADGELTSELSEPIAADLREDKDGRASAFLKLLAGLLGVGYDTLRRRHLVRRQRQLALIASASVVGMVITSGLATAAWFARLEADVQRGRAQAEAETARQTTDFLLSLFSVVDPSEARGNTVTAREILDQGAGRIDSDLADQPDVQATLMTTMGSVYRSLGLYQPAGRLVEKALGIRVSLYGMQHPDVAQTNAELAEIRRLEGEFEAAEKMFVKSIELQQLIDPDDKLHLAVLKAGLGGVLGELGRYAEARPLFEEALALRRAEVGGTSELVARSLEELGLNLFELGELENAERYLREAVVMYAAVFAEEPHPLRAEAINNLAYVLHGRGEVAEAGAYFEQSLAMNRILLGEAHPSLAVDMSNVAFILREQGRYDEAQRYQMDVIAMNRELLGEQHPEVAGNLLNLAFIQYDKGDTAGALASLGESIQKYREVFPTGHPDLARALTNMGGWLTDAGDFEAAEAYLQESLAMQRALLGDDHLRVAFSLATIARLYLETGRFELARDLSFEAGALFVANFSEEHWRVAWARSIEGAAHLNLGDYEIAEGLLLGSYEVLSSDPSARSSAVASAEQYVTEFNLAVNRLDDAKLRPVRRQM